MSMEQRVDLDDPRAAGRAPLRRLERFLIEHADVLLEMIPPPRRSASLPPGRRTSPAALRTRRHLILLAGRLDSGRGPRPPKGAGRRDGDGSKAEKPERPSRVSAARAPADANRSVLLVEDDPLMLMALGQALAARGFDVAEAPTGTAALEAMRAGTFGAVVLDLRLPDVHGLEVLRDMKRSPDTRATPVVVLTAAGTSVERERAFEEGCERFLTKPPNLHELVAILERLIAAPARPLRLIRPEEEPDAHE